MESFGIAAFRSRQAVLRFDDQLRKAGIPTQIITTPRAISMGCGLSIRFDQRALPSAMEIYHTQQPSPNLIGFYIARNVEGRISVTSVRV